MKKVLLVLAILVLAVAMIACGDPAETDAPDTNIPETNAPETDPPETEHVHDLEIVDVPATCQTRGYRTETCKTCGEEVVNTAYPKTACTPVAAATCTADSVCSVCGEVVEKALGHTFGEAVVVAATCKADGSSTTTCSVCNTTEATVIPMIDHVIGTVTEEVAPTSCSQKGYKKGACVACGDEVTVDVVIAHEYANDGFVIDENGAISATCTVCGGNGALALETVLKLDFENTDLRTEVAANEKGESFTVHDKTNSGGAFETVGDRTVLATSSAPAFIEFDPNLFVGSSYYVVSFDFSYNAEKDYGSTRPTLFAFIPGWSQDGAVKNPSMSWGTCAKLDTVNMKLAAVASNGAEITDANSIDITLGEWHNITIVVNNTTGARNVYIDGVYKNTPMKDGVINEANIEKYQYFCFRFNDQSGNQPQIDNFKMYIVD